MRVRPSDFRWSAGELGQPIVGGDLCARCGPSNLAPETRPEEGGVRACGRKARGAETALPGTAFLVQAKHWNRDVRWTSPRLWLGERLFAVIYGCIRFWGQVIGHPAQVQQKTRHDKDRAAEQS